MILLGVRRCSRGHAEVGSNVAPIPADCLKLMKLPTLANKRLLGALVCYAILALIGALALDGILRAAVLCLFAILAVKTLIHAHKDEEMP
jgi:hypothetical protein